MLRIVSFSSQRSTQRRFDLCAERPDVGICRWRTIKPAAPRGALAFNSNHPQRRHKGERASTRKFNHFEEL